MITLANKYRPKTFEEILGQTYNVRILQRQIETGNTKNAYIFCGSTGTGKTATARVFANTLNPGLDPIEIDAASNSGVDNVRNIIQDAQERSLNGGYKVYIIDEVQAMSSAAWQAFLKCLEEPPAGTVFILCTTDPQKVPGAVLNRLQRFNFNKVPTDLIRERLKHICLQEGFINFEDSIDYISKVVDGCVREAITNLDKVASFSSTFDLETTVNILNRITYDTYFKLINLMIDGKCDEVISCIEDLYNRGKDLKLFVNELLAFVLDVSKYTLLQDVRVTKIPECYVSQLQGSVNFENALDYYLYVADRVLSLKNMVKEDVDIKSTVEVICLQITRMQ